MYMRYAVDYSWLRCDTSNSMCYGREFSQVIEEGDLCR